MFSVSSCICSTGIGSSVSCCPSLSGFFCGTKPPQAPGSISVRSRLGSCIIWGFPNGYVFPGSIQFSILAGRILFKDLRYYTSNQTVRFVKGQLSWRYWIRKPTEEGDLRYARVGAEDVGRESGLPSASVQHCCNCDQGRQHGHWLVAYIYPCREQNGFFITVLPHTTILYLKCQENPFTDLTRRRLSSLRPFPKVIKSTQVRISKHPRLKLIRTGLRLSS